MSSLSLVTGCLPDSQLMGSPSEALFDLLDRYFLSDSNRPFFESKILSQLAKVRENHELLFQTNCRGETLVKSLLIYGSENVRKETIEIIKNYVPSMHDEEVFHIFITLMELDHKSLALKDKETEFMLMVVDLFASKKEFLSKKILEKDSFLPLLIARAPSSVTLKMINVLKTDLKLLTRPDESGCTPFQAALLSMKSDIVDELVDIFKSTKDDSLWDYLEQAIIVVERLNREKYSHYPAGHGKC